MRTQIIIENPAGINNTLERYQEWNKLGSYRNLSTAWVTPTRGVMGTRVAFTWMNVMGGFNQPLVKMIAEGYEVAQAYNQIIIALLADPTFSKYQYLLTVEEDNMPPREGVIRLYETIQHYDVVGGLYWTKGKDEFGHGAGVPMIYGKIDDPKDFTPCKILVPNNEIQECNGLGMGFTLFRMDMFRNPGFEFGQWFKTITENGEVMTQDLYFARNAKKLGYKFACDTRVKVGHYDHVTGEVF